MQAYVYLAIAIFGEVVGTTALKASDGMSKWGPSVLVIVGYGLSFWLLSLAMRSLPVAVIYAIWCGVGVSAIAIIGQVMYNEPISLTGALGMALIVTGIVLLQLPTTAGQGPA